MATDVVALMDFLRIKKAAIVGWSDGRMWDWISQLIIQSA